MLPPRKIRLQSASTVPGFVARSRTDECRVLTDGMSISSCHANAPAERFSLFEPPPPPSARYSRIENNAPENRSDCAMSRSGVPGWLLLVVSHAPYPLINNLLINNLLISQGTICIVSHASGHFGLRLFCRPSASADRIQAKHIGNHLSHGIV